MWKIRNGFRLLVLLPALIYSLGFISSSNGESYGYFEPDQFSFARRDYEIGGSEGEYPFSIDTDTDPGYSVEPIPARVPWMYLNSRYRMEVPQNYYHVNNDQRISPLSRQSDEDADVDSNERENDDEDEEDDEENEDDISDEDEKKDEEEDDDENVRRQVKKKNETLPVAEDYSDYEKYPFVVNAILDELF